MSQSHHWFLIAIFSALSLGVSSTELIPDPAQVGAAIGGKTDLHCEWDPGFHLAGLSIAVHASAIFDDGTGPSLYVGGNFRTSADQKVAFIAKWDGENWIQVGQGLDSKVSALLVYDDGSGPALFAGGLFSGKVAKWDGVEWIPLTMDLYAGAVEDLVVYENGDGAMLVAGGDFWEHGASQMHSVARWDGSTWIPFDSGLTDGRVEDLAVHDFGSGPVLIAGGQFSMIDGFAANHIAQWNGTSWSALGDGVDGRVFALAIHDDGDGEELVVGGYFQTAGQIAAQKVASWDGVEWSALGTGLESDPGAGILTLLSYSKDGSPRLAVGGIFESTGDSTPAPGFAEWDGSAWVTSLDPEMIAVYSLLPYPDPAGSNLLVGGHPVGGETSDPVGLWSGSEWTPLTSTKGPGDGFGWTTECFEIYDDGSGPALFAGGGFNYAGGGAVYHLAKWDGASWSPLGSGLNGTVYSLAVYDDGSGPKLVASGSFTVAGEVPARHIAQWDGTSWSPLGSGLDHFVTSMVVYNDGNGPRLVAQDGVHLAQWDGIAWSDLGFSLRSTVNDLAVYDDGTGSKLVLGGRFHEPDSDRWYGVALWDGTSLSHIGSLTEGWVSTVMAYTDATEPKLVAGGYFPEIGGVAASSIAAWDGTSWHPMGHPAGESSYPTYVWDLGIVDYGNGPFLMAGGILPADLDASGNIWELRDESTWSPVGSGTDGLVTTFIEHDDGSGPALFVGGGFELASDTPSLRIGKYSCRAIEPGPLLDIPHEVPATTDRPVTVPVVLTTDSALLASTNFSVDYDETCLAFSDMDTDADGIPDALSYHGPSGYQLFVDFDGADTDGEIDISLFDGSAPIPLMTGTLISIDFDVTCSPDSGEIVAPIRFSTDPAPTFGDVEAQDVDGGWSDGSVVIYGGLRGDCNGSGMLGSADLTAGELEIFDGDGAFWTDVLGGTFAGLPVGCDANADTTVDAGDLSCIHRLIFGQTCAVSPLPASNPAHRGEDGEGPSRLELGPWEVPVMGGRVVSTLELHSADWDVNSLVVSLDLDTTRYTFNLADADADGIPDAVRVSGDVPSNVSVRWDVSDTDGELDLVLTHFGVDASTAFSDPFRVDIEVEMLDPPSGSPPGYVVQPFRFSSEPGPSLGDVEGRSLVPRVSLPITGLFIDGFESGGIERWSMEVP